MTTPAISWAAVSSKPQTEREPRHDQHRLNRELPGILGWQIVAGITVIGRSRSDHRLEDAIANVEARP